MGMDRKIALIRARVTLAGSRKLSGLLARFGQVRVFPPPDLNLIPDSEDNEPQRRDYVAFTIEGHQLMAEYQGVKELAP